MLIIPCFILLPQILLAIKSHSKHDEFFRPSAQLGLQLDGPEGDLGVAIDVPNPIKVTFNKRGELEADRRSVYDGLFDNEGNYNVGRYCRLCEGGQRRFCSRCLKVRPHRFQVNQYPGVAPPEPVKEAGFAARVARPDLLPTTVQPTPQNLATAVGLQLPATTSSVSLPTGSPSNPQVNVLTQQQQQQLLLLQQQQQLNQQQQLTSPTGFNQQAGFLALQSGQPAAGLRQTISGNANYGPAVSGYPQSNSLAIGNSYTSRFPAVTASGTSLSQSYGVPNRPSQNYGVPNRPSQSYGVPNRPSQSYGVPNRPSQSYGAPNRPSQSYGAPNRKASKFGFQGKFNRPSQSYGPPRNSHSKSKGQKSSSYYRRPSSSYGDSNKFSEFKDKSKIKSFFENLFSGFGKGDSYSSYSDSHGSYSELRPQIVRPTEHKGECPDTGKKSCHSALSRRPCLRFVDWECEHDEKCCYHECLGHPVCTKPVKSWWKLL